MSETLRLEAESKYPTRTVNGPDYKAWAKRFAYRFQHGDKSLEMIQITFAHQALGIELPKKD